MVYEIREFQVTIAAGTPKAAPSIQALTMPTRIVRAIHIRVPPGPRGEVGFALGSAGQPVLPWNPGAWIVANDDTVKWDVAGQIESGAWQFIAYNTGQYPHTLYVTFLADPPQLTGRPSLSAPAPLSGAALARGG